MRATAFAEGTAVFLLASVATIACGSTAASIATRGNRDASLEAGDFDVSVADAEVADAGQFGTPVDASTIDAAPCIDDAVAPDSGAPFSCPGTAPATTCWSGSQMCVTWSGGQIRHPDFYPWGPGCQPFPCGCGGSPGCGCLGNLGAIGCLCSDDEAGVVRVQCSAP